MTKIKISQPFGPWRGLGGNLFRAVDDTYEPESGVESPISVSLKDFHVFYKLTCIHVGVSLATAVAWVDRYIDESFEIEPLWRKSGY